MKVWAVAILSFSALAKAVVKAVNSSGLTATKAALICEDIPEYKWSASSIRVMFVLKASWSLVRTDNCKGETRADKLLLVVSNH